MDCFASDASTLVGDAAPHDFKDVDYVKPAPPQPPAWDPAAAMRRHLRTKRDRELKARRSPLADRVMGIDRSKTRERERSPAPARPHVSICRSFVSTGSCPYGPNCSFDHPAPARAPTPQQQQAARAPTPQQARPPPPHQAPAPPPPPPPPPQPVPQAQAPAEPKTVYLPVPAVPPMFYSTYRRGSNGELIDPALLPAPVQAQKSLYYRTKPCRYWAQDGVCPKGDKCTFIHDPSLAAPQSPPSSPLGPLTPPPVVRRPSAAAVYTPPAKPPREPHPAWRVVGGGVTLANARAQPGGDAGADSEEEEAVECLTGLSVSQQSQPSQPSQSSQPAQAFAQPQQQQPYQHPHAQPAPQVQVQYAPQPQQQGYAAPLPSPVYAPAYPTFNPGAPYAVAAPPGQPLFAYAYPAPAYLWPAPPSHSSYPSPSVERRESYDWPVPPAGVYYVAPAPHALELGVVRDAAMVDALADAGVDVAGLDGSGRPLDLDEGAQPLSLGWEGKDGWHGEEEEELDVQSGVVLTADVEMGEQAVDGSELFAWGAVEHLCWADDVEMEDRRREQEMDGGSDGGDGGRRTSPSTPRGHAGRLFELFAANESPR